jgi:predicted nucleic acid-binding protein
MANYFFDSSGLVKRYIDEKGSAWIQEITASQSGNALYIARITGAELIAAITRRQRRGATTVSDANAAVDAFRMDFTRAYFSLDVTPAVVSRAMNLAERYGLRGYDSVQLAAALELRDLCFASGLPLPVLIAADTELSAAAEVEGLAVDNPNSH